MFQHNFDFLREGKLSIVEAPAVAGTSTLTTDILDMTGYDSVAFIALLGDVTSGSVLALQVLGNDTNDTVSPTTYAAAVAGLTAGASDADNKAIIVDVQKPRDKYVYATLARGTQNAVVNGILAYQYNKHQKPFSLTDLAALYAASVSVNDPA